MILGLLAVAPLAQAGPPQLFGQAIDAGEAHSVGLRGDGTVWAWGWNGFGQLGDGTNTNRATPVQVSGLTGATAVAAGYGHSLALRSDGTVWAWGWNQYGQLGGGPMDGTTVQVPGLTAVTAIAAGGHHSLALRGDGTVWAWGSNASGQLGDGSFMNHTTPVQVSGLTGVIAIAADYYHSVALRQDGTVWAWGDNWAGQLGDGTTTSHDTPVQVSGLTGVTAIAAGGLHSLALRNDGTLRAWGWNGSGQLGDGTTTNRTTPVQVSSLTDVTAIAAGYSHSVAVRVDATLRAWGDNYSGQLGDGTTTNRTTPVQVSSLTGVTATAAGGAHSLAVRVDATVRGWGDNWAGQLGDGTTNGSHTPVESQFHALPPPNNNAPETPALGSPSHDTTLPPHGPHAFSLTATDPEGDSYRGQIDISTSTGTPVATLLTGQVASGATASATTATPLPDGFYRWTARAIDWRGGVSGAAPSRTFTVGTASSVPAPSGDCTGGVTLIDGYMGGTYVRAQARQDDDDSLLVCLRADGVNVEHGGRFAFTAGAPGLPQAPSTDSAWESCRDANPAGVVIDGFLGPETPAGDGYTHLAWHQTADEAWLCLNYQGDTVRVVIPTESGGTPTVPATFTADPPGAANPDPVAPPPGPSSTCRTNGVEHANVTTSPGHVWLGSWVESSNRAHVCVRVDGLSATGGRLTVDTSVSPGVAPVIGDETLADKPASCSARLNDTSTPNLAVYTTPAGANPGKVCVRAASTSWRVLTLGTSGSPSPAIPVTWAADPAA